MPRARRITPAGVPFHIVNRGNEKQRIFFEDADYQGFLDRVAKMRRCYQVEVPGICLMPTHFHMTVIAKEDQAIPAAMHWLQTRISRNVREVTQTFGHGHVFQRRYWSRAISSEREFLQVLRYVEANPLAAGLVKRAEEWRWSSLWLRQNQVEGVLDQPRVALPDDWVELVNVLPPAEQVAALSSRVRREPHRRRK